VKDSPSSATVSTSRRRLLKQLTATGGTAVTLQALPAAWVRPMVQSTILPAHAQMTGVAYFGTDLEDQGGAADSSHGTRWFDKLAGLIVPAANAIPIAAGGACATPMGDQVSVTWQNRANSRRWQGTLPANGGIGGLSQIAHSPKDYCGDPPCSTLFARIIKMDASGVQVEIKRCGHDGYYLFTIPPSTSCNLPALDGTCDI